MKTLFILAITMLTFSAFSQSGVWVTSTNINEVQKSVEFVRAASDLQSSLSINKAFPASKNSKLQNVYEITCNCDETDLYIKMHTISGLSGIEYTPHYETLGLPNDYNLSVPYDYALESINAQGAWEYTHGDSSVLISITDAGFYLSNSELYPKFLSGNLNFNMSNPSHGTAVATNAAGATNNMYGKSSIGYNCSLDLRAMSYNSILEATYAGAKVINCSWAAGCYYSQYGQDIINEAYNNGSIIVAAAGNGTTCSGASNLVYPASYEHVISVTSVGPSNNHERFAGDPTVTHQHNNMVDICAPGYDVYVTTSEGTFLPATGTSFAAPYVSGTIGLMLSVNPCLTFEQVEDILRETSDTTIYEINPQYAGLLGSGKLNSELAVQMAMQTNTINVTVSSSYICDNFTHQLFTSEFYGEAPYTIEWSNGQTGPLCIINTPGIYTLSVSDSRGCKYYEEFTIPYYEELNVESSVSNVTCYGSNNGSIDLSVFGGNEQYSYLWFNGDTTSYMNNLSAGTYEVTITDGNGCSKTSQITIDQPLPLETTINSNYDLIDLTVTGGTYPYEFFWYNPNQEDITTEDIHNPLPGFYEVLVTDANGCLISDNAFVFNNTSGVEEFTITEFQIYPNPSNGKFTINTGRDSDCNLTISNMNGQQIINTQFNKELNVENLPTGIYIITVDSTSKKIVVE